MAKFWIISVLVVIAFAQVSLARDLAEALNVNIRNELSLYGKFAQESDSTNYLVDLKKLIGLSEEALKSESAEEKEKFINTVQMKFSTEFNNWIIAKLEEAQVNDDIQDAIEFYNSLLSSKAEHEAEIKKTISTLENILKESNLKLKEEEFSGLTKTFTPEFEKFLKENALPSVNHKLHRTAEFFENLLHDKNIKFAKEIENLKVKTEAALNGDVSLDEKNKVLENVTYTDNQELNEYLHKKNVEYT